MRGIKLFPLQVILLVSWVLWLQAQESNSTKPPQEVTTYHGEVTSVEDGRTITIRSADKKYRVRLAGISVPTLPKGLNQKSRESLSQLAKGESVIVTPVHNLAAEGLLLGKVLLNGQDLALEQVRRGFAWESQEERKLLSEGDAGAYKEGWQSARKAKRGMWSDELRCKEEPSDKSNTQSMKIGPSDKAEAPGPVEVVRVELLVDERGHVISATPLCGNPIFREAAQRAALQARFSPTKQGGVPVKVQGQILYRFVLEE
jgi:endonuclease YncB( thermonuclease family)